MLGPVICFTHGRVAISGTNTSHKCSTVGTSACIKQLVDANFSQDVYDDLSSVAHNPMVDPSNVLRLFPRTLAAMPNCIRLFVRRGYCIVRILLSTLSLSFGCFSLAVGGGVSIGARPVLWRRRGWLVLAALHDNQDKTHVRKPRQKEIVQDMVARDGT